MSLEEVKTLLGVDDERIEIIYAKVEQRLLTRLKRTMETIDNIPIELEYIVDEVAIARFNRIGSEGMQSESMDGHSATYVDADFKPYETDITDYINQYSDPKKGVVRFL